MLDLPKIEEKILKFWKKKRIFEKSLEKRKGRKRFVFYEGPPFANGLPGIHHLLTRAFKDIILRYKTMQGFYVERRAGWDTHGLPTEMEAEKKLGIKTKKEIEKIGIEKFIETCRESVFIYKKEWEEFTERIGFWLDFKNAYITCSNEYIESLWWILKQIWQKGLLYEDYKVVHYCPRCGTSLSSHEVAQGYKTIKENSIYFKIPIKNQEDTYLLVWTTTPWTLPGNVAVAVDENSNYVKAKVGSDYLILLKERLGVLEEDYKVIEEIKGKDLLGLEYEPLYLFIKPDKKAYYVVGGDFVSTEEGTGLVHMAPAFGEDDMRIGRENNLPVLMTVDEEGRFKKEIKDWAGIFVKDADPKIIEDLKKRNLLYKEEIYEHEYPFCWRCKNPLLYYAKSSWFIKMSELKNKLIENNQKINWIPSHIKEGRFGEWLKETKDWNLSRERYWGTPLPIWRCQTAKNQNSETKDQNECSNIKVIESIKELEKLSGKKVKELHRPYIDKITFKCEQCGGEMKRIPEVIDCWFDSGSMPFAQWHYPFENKEKIDKKEFFPADFISEGIDQTRGWFYTLLAVSSLLDKGPSYKNVVCLGLVLDSERQKMSKSKGNIVVPKEVIEKYGADCARFYFYTVNPEGEEKRFDFKEVQVLYRKFFDTLWQSYNFFSLYKSKNFLPEKKFSSSNILDKWIISKIESLNLSLTEKLDGFKIVDAARLLKDFVDDLSNWYIRRSRQRFQNPDKDLEKKEAENTLYYVLRKIALLSAPFTPFFADEIYQRLEGEMESVHLEHWPKPEKEMINQSLEKKMEKTRGVIEKGLAERTRIGIKVRQPLPEIKFNQKELEKEEVFWELIKEELNVKKVIFDSSLSAGDVVLNTAITPELKREGEFRELVRVVKMLRKQGGLTPEQKILLEISFSFWDIEKLKKETGAQKIEVKSLEEIGKEKGIKKEVKIGDKKEMVLIKNYE